MTGLSATELGPVEGHGAAKDFWREAVSSGRLHHGWLLRGPRGIGKARLAIQFAAGLLGGAPQGTTAEDPLGRLLVAGSHPDFRMIRKPVDEKGKEKSDIPVDSVRELASFFSLRPALGGWRVAIVDAVDELNRFGANALLKTLEEPPERAVLLLVSHGEQALLPTIRSRCRLLPMDLLPIEETLRALTCLGLSASEAAVAAQLAPGRPGRGAAYREADVGAGADALLRAFRRGDDMDARDLYSILTQSSKSDLALSAAMQALRTDLEARARRETDPVRAGQFAAAALELGRAGTEAQALNMDRAQAAAMALERARRHTG